MASRTFKVVLGTMVVLAFGGAMVTVRRHDAQLPAGGDDGVS
jgi:hypothetical protein